MRSPRCQAAASRFAPVASLLIATPTLLAQATVERPFESHRIPDSRGENFVIFD